MSDISMCSDSKCPLRIECFRYRAAPSNCQSYSDFKFDDGCDYFYPFEENKWNSRPMDEIESATFVANGGENNN